MMAAFGDLNAVPPTDGERLVMARYDAQRTRARTAEAAGLIIGSVARFADHLGFVGTIEARDDTDTFFDVVLRLADGRGLNARWTDLVPDSEAERANDRKQS